MTEVIGIRYNGGDLNYVLPNQNYKEDDRVLIKTEYGRRLAEVALTNSEIEPEKLPKKLDPVLGLAKKADVLKEEKNKQNVRRYRQKVDNLISKHGLDMKIVDIVFTLDRTRVMITFVAEGRVDFRALLKDLAALFHTRIQLRQISEREESKVYGSIGPCGRATCCSSFLGEFPVVSIKMAKEQNISLNSKKLNGRCGKLLCCLSYEDDFYKEAKANYPDFGDLVTTKDGIGKVTGIDVIAEMVKVRLEDKKGQVNYALEEIEYG